MAGRILGKGVRRLTHTAAVASLICISLSVEARSDECSAKIRNILKDRPGDTVIVVYRGQTCKTEAIQLGSRPVPRECVVGAMVTAKGTYVQQNGTFPVIELEDVTDIACR